jgi:hypothetical protein
MSFSFLSVTFSRTLELSLFSVQFKLPVILSSPSFSLSFSLAELFFPSLVFFSYDRLFIKLFFPSVKKFCFFSAI